MGEPTASCMRQRKRAFRLFVGLQEVRRPGRTEFAASGFRVFICGTDKGGGHGVGIAVEKTLCKTFPGTPRSTLTSASWL